MTSSFFFATLTYARVARLHRKEKKEKKNKEKIFKIQTIVRKTNLHLNVQKTRKSAKRHLLDLHGQQSDFFFPTLERLHARHGCLVTSADPIVDTTPYSFSTILCFFSPLTTVAFLFMFFVCFIFFPGSTSTIEELIRV